MADSLTRAPPTTPFQMDDVFYKMGVTVHDAELQAIIERFDADGSGEMDAEEFCDMITTIMKDDGGWSHGPGGTLDSKGLRALLSVCGHIVAGCGGEQVAYALRWVRAEDALVVGETDLEELTNLEDDCGALTGSEPLLRARKVRPCTKTAAHYFIAGHLACFIAGRLACFIAGHFDHRVFICTLVSKSCCIPKSYTVRCCRFSGQQLSSNMPPTRPQSGTCW